MLRENLRAVRENMEKAAVKSGRALNDITLIGVTKTISPDRIQELERLGVKDFGENKVQELLNKYSVISPSGGEPVNWHLIGHLQRNKVKYIMDKVTLIHSVDSQRLAIEINRRALEMDIIKDILVEVNVGEEASKQGISVDGVSEFVKELLPLTGVRVQGLMTVAPYVENPADNRELFRKMFQLFVDINENIPNNKPMSFLSMGMTNDYMVAIEEGANMVRVGTGIFGSRL